MTVFAPPTCHPLLWETFLEVYVQFCFSCVQTDCSPEISHSSHLPWISCKGTTAPTHMGTDQSRWQGILQESWPRRFRNAHISKTYIYVCTPMYIHACIHISHMRHRIKYFSHKPELQMKGVTFSILSLIYLILFYFREILDRDKERAHSIKYLSCKYKDPSSAPRAYVIQAWCGGTCL